MKHAFLIIAHNNFEQIRYLIELLADDEIDFYIHIDKKNKIDASVYFKDVATKSFISIFSEIKVNWGGKSLIDCELSLFKHAHHQKKYDYYHLISGNDFCLYRKSDLKKFFNENYPANFIAFAKYQNKVFPGNESFVKYIDENRDEDFDDRISTFHLFHDNLFFNRNRYILKFDTIFSKLQSFLGIDRLKNSKLVVCKGSNWGSFTDKFVEYLLSEEIIKIINKMFKNSMIGDELYKQTIIFNSPLKNTIFIDKNGRNTNLRKIDWKRGNPYVFTSKDWDELTHNLTTELFARKFDYQKDPQIIIDLYENLME